MNETLKLSETKLPEYASNVLVFADSLEGLQQLMSKINEKNQQYGLAFNINKIWL